MRENKNIIPAKPAIHSPGSLDGHGAYPEVLILESIAFVHELYQHFPDNHGFSREAMAAALADRITLQKNIAASVHYELLKRIKGLYKFTRQFKNVNYPVSRAIIIR